MNEQVKFEELKGKTLTEINIDRMEDVITFHTTEKDKYILYHRQECCEDVYIEDVCGRVADLIGRPILLAEMVSNLDLPARNPEDEDPRYCYDGSHTWTFYKLATEYGYVTIRWYGESNGYYSEEVDFIKKQ